MNLYKSVCINSSNLHAGGGVQVATSFIDELSHLNRDGLNVSVFASCEVAKNLSQLGVDTSVFNEFKVIDSYGLWALLPKFSRYFKNFDLIFSIFGPAYFFSIRSVNVVGFAQPWIIHPETKIYGKATIAQRLRDYCKFKLQAWFFRRSDQLIVELEHVRQGLIKKGIGNVNNIYVVHNCLSRLYFSSNVWMPVKVLRDSENFAIGFVGRDYPHKNTSILPVVKDILFHKYRIDVEFFVTLKDEEWAEKSDIFRKIIRNVGSLDVVQCPDFYRQMDAIIFPSLLECFSATPMEALVMKKPLFASDRGFVRDVCGDFAHYFDPLDPESIASVIATYIKKYSFIEDDRIEAAYEHVKNFSNARQRAVDYLTIIRKSIN